MIGECDPEKCPVEIKGAKSRSPAPGRRLWNLLPLEHSHLVAHFRASSALLARRQERGRKQQTRWLCWQSAAKRSPLVKFPDHWENRGNFVSRGLIGACLAPERQRLAVEFPIRQNRESSEETGSVAVLNGKSERPHLLDKWTFRVSCSLIDPYISLDAP